MPDKKYQILIIRFSSLGDIILTTPTLDALKENYKNSEIYFLTRRKYQGFLEADPRIASVIYFDPEGEDKGIPGLFRLIGNLNQKNFDIVIDLHSSLRSFFIRNLVKAQKKIYYRKRLIPRLLMVYFKKWYKRIYSDKAEPISTVDCYLRALEKTGMRVSNRIPRLYLKDEQRLWAKGFFKKIGLKREEILIGIAPGAKWEMKRWDKDKFSSVAETLSQELPAKILLTGDEEDRKLIEDIKDQIGEDKVVLSVGLHLNRLMSLIERCELFISNDSGPMHLASALGVPTIGIFGPTAPWLGFSPTGLEDKVFWVEVECSPCSLHGEKRCVKESRFCMDNIKPEKIIEEAKRILTADKVIFLDRDGTINVDKDFVSRIEQIEFNPGAKEALKILQGIGYKLVIISNQSGVARGIMTKEQVEEVNRFILSELDKEGIKIEGVYYCPHHRDENCSCRKPRAGLIRKALREHRLKLRDAWVIGDVLSDILLAKNIKIKSILVLTGYGQGVKQRIESNQEIHQWQKPDHIANNLLEAALWIKTQAKAKSEDTVLNSSEESCTSS